MRRTYKCIVGAISLFTVPGHALAADERFDLICSGTIKSEIIGDKPKYEAYSYHFRLDLSNMIYCYTESGKSCNNLKRILSVSETNISLKNVDKIEGNEIIKNVEFFNRSTGIHYAHYVSKYTDRTAKMLAIIWEGSCDKMPFSGFPMFEQKF